MAFLLLWLLLGTKLIIVGIIAGALIFIGAGVFGIALNKYRLTAAEQKQVEVNEGINEQIIMLDDRIKQVERQRDDYYKALEKRVPFMSLDYMKNVQQIKQFLVDGKADTCEEAVDMFEDSMLLQQMTDIMTKSETIEPVKDDKERFGDPLKIIKEKQEKTQKGKEKKRQKVTFDRSSIFTPLRSFCEDPQFAIDRIMYEREKNILTKTWVVAVLASICCMLWGSAFSCVKIGYSLMNITTNDSGSQLVFGGHKIFCGRANGSCHGKRSGEKNSPANKDFHTKDHDNKPFSDNFAVFFLLHRSSPTQRE